MAVVIGKGVCPHLYAYALYGKLSVASSGLCGDWAPGTGVTQTFAVGNDEGLYRSEQHFGRYFEAIAPRKRPLWASLLARNEERNTKGHCSGRSWSPVRLHIPNYISTASSQRVSFLAIYPLVFDRRRFLANQQIKDVAFNFSKLRTRCTVALPCSKSDSSSSTQKIIL
jgi:hypothetical protein